MEYPAYKFSCGCIYSVGVIRKQKTHDGKTFHCPEHWDAKCTFQVKICADCGSFFDANKLGSGTVRCQACAEKHAMEYHQKYYKNGRKGLGLYKKHGRSKADVVSDSGLQPNPVIVNPYRSPCGQGCRLAKMDKRDKTCLDRCEYRIAYDNMLSGDVITTPGIIKTEYGRTNLWQWRAA